MNIPRLKKIAKHILKNPPKHDMDNWLSPKYKKDRTICGTTECIAGSTVMQFSNKELIKKINSCIDFWINVKRDFSIADFIQEELGLYFDEEAQVLLELTNEQARRLFFVDDWPSIFRDRYRNAKTLKTKAQVTHDRIMYFIKTGGY